MRASTIARLILAPVLLLAAVAVQAQTLGDVARKEEERRKTVKAPAKVYTNDNLRNVDPPAPSPVVPSSLAGQAAGSAAPPAAPAPSDAAAQAAPGAGTPEAGVRDEKYWRGRIDAARAALTRSETFVEALQSRVNALSADFVNRDDPAQRNVIAADRQKALAELDRVKQEIAQHQKAIAAAQEEGRRAGAPAGWLR
jgi:hypothetical protein